MARKVMNFLVSMGLVGLIGNNVLASDTFNQAKDYHQKFSDVGIRSTMVGDINVSGYSVPGSLVYTLVSHDNEVLVLEDDVPLGSLDRVMNCNAFRYPFPCKKVDDMGNKGNILYGKMLSISDKILEQGKVSKTKEIVSLYKNLVKNK